MNRMHTTEKIKHHIIYQIYDAIKVLIYKNEKTNIINYDKLENKLINS